MSFLIAAFLCLVWLEEAFLHLLPSHNSSHVFYFYMLLRVVTFIPEGIPQVSPVCNVPLPNCSVVFVVARIAEVLLLLVLHIVDFVLQSGVNVLVDVLESILKRRADAIRRTELQVIDRFVQVLLLQRLVQFLRSPEVFLILLILHAFLLTLVNGNGCLQRGLVRHSAFVSTNHGFALALASFFQELNLQLLQVYLYVF